MYLGYNATNCTAKNQLTLPSKFASETGRKLLIAKWFEHSLVVLPWSTGIEILKRVIEDNSSLLPEVRDLERFFYGSATEVELDIKKRFVIPKDLREYAQIGENAVFVGVGYRIELWDQKIYQDYGKIRELQIRSTAITHYNRIVANKEKNEAI